MTLPDLPPLRRVIQAHNLGARRSLGQHFLLDSNLCARIARTAGDLDGRSIIEVGPGPGCLTRALLAAGATLTAIEVDGRCVGALSELARAYPGRLRVIEGDALEIDPRTLVPPPRKIVANLPYNISIPLLQRWLADVKAYESLTLMFQKEVADRLTAGPGSKAYGRLSVLTHRLCEVDCAFNVDRRAFTPPPKVTSTVVTLTPRQEPLAPASAEALEKVTAAAFGQRRKMLRSSLKSTGLDPELLGIDGARRAETLTVEEFCVLARAFEADQ